MGISQGPDQADPRGRSHKCSSAEFQKERPKELEIDRKTATAVRRADRNIHLENIRLQIRSVTSANRKAIGQQFADLKVRIVKENPQRTSHFSGLWVKMEIERLTGRK